MNKQNIIIVLGTAHRMREPGKCSPDGRLKECVYSREIVSDIAAILKSYGYRVIKDFEALHHSSAANSQGNPSEVSG